MFVIFKTEWHRKGEALAKGDVRDIEDWEAETVIQLGKARLLSAAEIAQPTQAEEAALIDEKLADLAGEDGEGAGARYKSGSMPAGAPAAVPGKRSRKVL